MGRESTVERNVCRKAFKLHGIRNHKLQGAGGAGNEDRLFYRSVGGRPVAAFVEFKRLNEKPRKLQEHRMKIHQMEGFPTAWFDNETDALNWLKVVFDCAHE